MLLRVVSRVAESESQGLGGFWVESVSDFEEHWESESDFFIPF